MELIQETKNDKKNEGGVTLRVSDGVVSQNLYWILSSWYSIIGIGLCYRSLYVCRSHGFI